MPEAERPTTPLTPSEPPELDERALRDHTLWMSIDEAFERLVELVHYGEVAVGELQRALEGGLPCKGISEIEKKLVLFAPATWRDQYRLYFTSALRVIHRHEQRPGGNIIRTVRDWRFYVLRSVFEAIWPTSVKVEEAKAVREVIQVVEPPVSVVVDLADEPTEAGTTEQPRLPRQPKLQSATEWLELALQYPPPRDTRRDFDGAGAEGDHEDRRTADL